MAELATRVCCKLAIVFLAFLAFGCAGDSPQDRNLIRVGGVSLKACGDDRFCGQINRPLNPSDKQSRLLSVGFKFYPRTDAEQSSRGVITILDGGPGYGATTYPDAYLTMLAPLRDRFDVLLVDNRGSGASSVLACKSLDGKPGLPAKAVKECGIQLGADAYYYGSSYAADDLASVLDALDIDQTSLYALSYGTYFAQVFASRHPGRLSKLVLESAFPVRETTPFYTTATPTLRRALTLTCVRSGGCKNDRDILPLLLDKLRLKPARGLAPDSSGKLRTVKLNPGSMFTALMHSSGGLVAYRDFDAAAAAYIDNDDSLPLLRLVSEGVSLHDPSTVSANPTDFSKALFVAVSCSDYPKLYNMRLAPPERRATLDKAVQTYVGSNPKVYAPFLFDEFRQSGFQENSVDLCLDWPPPPADWAPLILGEGLAKLKSLPVLVLSGEFDPLTTPAEGKIVARQFPAALHVIIANSVHAPGVANPSGCAGAIIANFIAGSGVDLRCAATNKSVRKTDIFAKNYSGFVRMRDGTLKSTEDALGSIAVATVDDAIARSAFEEEVGLGLRGGEVRYAYRGSTLLITLDKVRFVDDVAVSGNVKFDRRLYISTAKLQIIGPNKMRLEGTFTWDVEPHPVKAEMTAAAGTFPIRR